MPTEILLFGAGALGSFYASRLAQNPAVNVSCICRSNYHAVKAHGFKIRSNQFGDYSWKPTHVFSNAGEAQQPQTRYDFIIVSTKALPDINDDSALLTHLVSSNTAILLIQNGLGIEEPYHSRFPNNTIISAVAFSTAAQPEPGFIQHNKFTRLVCGPYPADTEKATHQNEMLCQLFAEGGVKDATPVSAKEVQQHRWHKVSINAATNPSSVLSGGCASATMANDPDMFEHLKGVIEEVQGVGEKVLGKRFEGFATAEQILESSKKIPGVPSMLTDWQNRRKMELEVILGSVMRQAKECGLSVPRVATMYYLLKTAQRRKDGWDPARL